MSTATNPTQTQVITWLASFMVVGSAQKIGGCHPDIAGILCTEWSQWAGFRVENGKRGAVLMTPYGKIILNVTPQIENGVLFVIDALDSRPKSSASIRFPATGRTEHAP